MNISIDKAIEWQLDMNASAIYKCILERDNENFEKLKSIINEEWFEKYVARLSKLSLIHFNHHPLGKVELSQCVIPEKSKKRISKKNVEPESFDAFILEYYNCFPSDAYTGDYKIKSGLSNCKSRLKTFMSTHKNYNQELILRATRLYVENKKKENYSFMKLAPYFISKEGQPSLLESMCESLLKGEKLGSKNTGNSEIG